MHKDNVQFIDYRRSTIVVYSVTIEDYCYEAVIRPIAIVDAELRSNMCQGEANSQWLPVGRV